MTTRELHLKAVDSAEEGGCNGCYDKSGPGQSYRVWQLTLRNQSIRLCDTCMSELPDVLRPGFDEVRKAQQVVLVDVGGPREMTKADMEARIEVLSDEMDANDEENQMMQAEIDALYAKIDALSP